MLKRVVHYFPHSPKSFTFLHDCIVQCTHTLYFNIRDFYLDLNYFKNKKCDY